MTANNAVIFYPDILEVSMNRKELVEKVKALGLPMGTYVVFGSGPLAAAGIRETEDVDLFVSDRLYTHMHENGWHETVGINGDHILKHGDYEVSRSWKFGTYHPHFSDLYAAADIVDGVPFVNLHEVRAWKLQSSRPKDRRDIELIDRYMAKKGWA